MDQLLTTETLIIELLLIVSLVAIVVRRLRIPYTVALVLVGLGLTVQQEIRFELTPEIILALFVPPLIFEAAFHLEWNKLRANLVTILLLAIPGVLASTVIVGFLVSWGTGLSLSSALVFGALIAATDPVAVIALFRAVNAPKSLAVLVEGESLFNDGTAIVVFDLMLAAALAAAGAEGGSGSGALFLLEAVLDFVVVAVGGLAVGAGLGWISNQIIARVDDYLIETTITTVLAFGAFLFAERFHVSGVLAVVAAGLISGNVGPRGMSPTTKVVLFNFWEYLAFLANSLVFLLIGLDVNLPELLGNLTPIAVAVGAVIVSRVLVIYGVTWLSDRGPRTIPWRYRHVLFWGGLRGAISLALVLSLPVTFADRALLQVMAFGVVLFTLLGQGTTMQLLLRRLGMVQSSEEELEYERRHGRLMAARAARDRIRTLYDEGMISAATWDALAPTLDLEVERQQQQQHELLLVSPNLRREEQEDAIREGLQAQRAMLTTLLSVGVISDPVYEELVLEVDIALEAPESLPPA